MPATKKNPLAAIRRASSSPFGLYQRTKSGSPSTAKSSKKPSHEQDNFDEPRLEDHGLIRALEIDQNLRDVAQYLSWIDSHMFDALPDRSGFNSTKTAELLNYRRRLPAVVTVAHVHALSKSPTSTEREIAELVQAGIIRRISIPDRGAGAQAIGDCLVLMSRWTEAVNASTDLADDVKKKYIRVMQSHAGEATISSVEFTQDEASTLIKAGFLTAASQFNAGLLMRPDSATIGTLTSLSTVGSRAATGTTAAVGGQNALLDAGGGSRSLSYARQDSYGPKVSAELSFSLPSIGAYLRLLEASRAHLVHLLSRSKYREAPASLLKDRWDGGVASSTDSSHRSRAPMASVLPAKTKKWKQFHGLSFRWILEECLGTGLIEAFNTGSVGMGVRLSR